MYHFEWMPDCSRNRCWSCKNTQERNRWRMLTRRYAVTRQTLSTNQVQFITLIVTGVLSCSTCVSTVRCTTTINFGERVEYAMIRHIQCGALYISWDAHMNTKPVLAPVFPDQWKRWFPSLSSEYGEWIRNKYESPLNWKLGPAAIFRPKYNAANSIFQSIKQQTYFSTSINCLRQHILRVESFIFTAPAIQYNTKQY